MIKSTPRTSRVVLLRHFGPAQEKVGSNSKALRKRIVIYNAKRLPPWGRLISIVIPQRSFIVPSKAIAKQKLSVTSTHRLPLFPRKNFISSPRSTRSNGKTLQNLLPKHINHIRRQDDPRPTSPRSASPPFHTIDSDRRRETKLTWE